MTDSIDTSEREAEEPRFISLPVREMRDEPVPHKPANALHVVLQLALEATPEQLPTALNALRGILAETKERDHTEQYLGMVPPAAQQLAPQPLTDWDMRGMLASSLKCWHRLTEEEAADLVQFVATHCAVGSRL